MKSNEIMYRSKHFVKYNTLYKLKASLTFLKNTELTDQSIQLYTAKIQENLALNRGKLIQHGSLPHNLIRQRINWNPYFFFNFCYP